jgi:hypothetical protein
LPPTLNYLAILTPPLTIKAPVEVEVESVVLFNVVAPATVKVPDKVVLPATLNCFAIPTPPLTIKAPFVVAVESVVSFNVNAFKLPVAALFI